MTSRPLRFVLAACLLSCISCASWFHSDPCCIVVRIVDGDTLIVSIEGEKERVRLRRLNAPELDEPGGLEAKAALRRKFPPGSPVTLTIYARDVYGRIIAEVRPEL